MDRLEQVTVLKKANVYYDGKVTSRTVLFADGTRKTLGVILPGAYEFGTGDREVMEILGGSLRALLPGAKEWETFSEGQLFEVPANSRFACATDGVCDYCCSYAKGE
ncbi:Pyrimidine/purine nucleoside phosphorylase [bioreactor metagenome]|uniref:Pyrimidine/purine nucleoside phosphorylase n=1 Tax=bioreactor metagenome TaxID=1076179 RepID=A0A645ANG7_9ZZZZ|nr:pyrimidine/purine nucleoside phosphorylase [Christensenella sp.]